MTTGRRLSSASRLISESNLAPVLLGRFRSTDYVRGAATWRTCPCRCGTRAASTPAFHPVEVGVPLAFFHPSLVRRASPGCLLTHQVSWDLSFLRHCYFPPWSWAS